jgi:hypothetical protein
MGATRYCYIDGPCGVHCGVPCGVKIVPRCQIVCVSLGDIERSNRARVRHQVLYLPRAPHRKQPDFAIMSGNSAQAPQRVVEPVAVEHGDDAHGLVVGLGLAEMSE